VQEVGRRREEEEERQEEVNALSHVCYVNANVCVPKKKNGMIVWETGEEWSMGEAGGQLCCRRQQAGKGACAWQACGAARRGSSNEAERGEEMSSPYAAHVQARYARLW